MGMVVQWLIIPLILGHHECLHVVLLRQDPIIGIRDFGRYALEDAVAHRVQILRRISMIVLAAPNAWLNVRMSLAQTGDVDVQSVPHVDPACVDDVETIASFTLRRERVDVKKIVSFNVVLLVGVVVRRTVHVFGEVLERSTGHLSVEVPVPRKYLQGERIRTKSDGSPRSLNQTHITVPPPAQQGAVCYPRLNSQFPECIQVGSYHVVEGIRPLFIRHNTVVVSLVVVTKKIICARLMEVFGVPDLILSGCCLRQRIR